MRISKEDLKQFEKKTFASGNNGSHYLDRTKQLLLKTFEVTEKREKSIDYLLTFSTISHSGYPLEALFIDENFNGYITYFFANSKSFDTLNEGTFTLFEMVKAIGDVSLQLRQIHHRGIIFNDMNSANQLIDHEGGHIIDFEDIRLPKQNYVPMEKYSLRYNGKILSANQKVDQLKQYIANLSLLYQMNLDKYYGVWGYVEDMPNLFSFNRNISEFLEEQLQHLEDPNTKLLEYFDILLPTFDDEERITFEGQVLRQRTGKKLALLYKKTII